ncbi:hypothetical protein [Pseudomonas sp. Irchel 3A7]|uniref:hypothetical protein n=1 Tax=Pseudomonas sp. Irchel 3A7 TaxID=2008913 RepID=UPI000BA3FB14|nr:hypothetical protein [Pseudomonas sp. Irchel 3A7]
MGTTIESSLPYVAEIAGLSLETQSFLYDRDDELKRRQAVDDAKAATMRAFRTAWIEAHIEDVIRCTKKSAFEGKPRCRWTSILMRYYDRRGIKAPDIETVRRVVKEFNGF